MHDEILQEQRQPAIWFRRQFGSKMSQTKLGDWLRRQFGSTTFRTKLGGLPNLASHIEWPRQTRTGTPLHFLAQIDLSQLPSTPLAAKQPELPSVGFLYFFADMIEEMLWDENGGPLANTRVVYADRAGSERSPPHDIPNILHEDGQRSGGFKTGISIYPQILLRSYVIDTFGGMYAESFVFDPYTAAAQTWMIASIEKAIGDKIPVFAGKDAWKAISATNPKEYIQEYDTDGDDTPQDLNCPLHQMLGVGANVQGTAEEARSRGEILLLQIDSDLALHEHFMFCDMGVAQFWIKPDDLAARRFDKAWATTEGG